MKRCMGMWVGCLAAAQVHGVCDTWSVSGDVAYFRREGSHNRELIKDTGGSHTCREGRLIRSLGAQLGMRLAMEYGTQRMLWEAAYLGIEPWGATCARRHTGSLSVPAVGQSHLDRVFVRYGSRFHNGEINMFGYLTDRWGDFFSGGWMVGVRYVGLQDKVTLHLSKGTVMTLCRVTTHNHAPLIQAGWRMGWAPTKRLSWDLILKAGVGVDRGRSDTVWVDGHHVHKRGVSTPFLWEGIVRASQVVVGGWFWEAAYQALYLNGVALPFDQLSRGDHHGYQAIGATLFHGLTAGMGWDF